MKGLPSIEGAATGPLYAELPCRIWRPFGPLPSTAGLGEAIATAGYNDRIGRRIRPHIWIPPIRGMTCATGPWPLAGFGNLHIAFDESRRKVRHGIWAGMAMWIVARRFFFKLKYVP